MSAAPSVLFRVTPGMLGVPAPMPGADVALLDGKLMGDGLEEKDEKTDQH